MPSTVPHHDFLINITLKTMEEQKSIFPVSTSKATHLMVWCTLLHSRYLYFISHNSSIPYYYRSKYKFQHNSWFVSTISLLASSFSYIINTKSHFYIKGWFGHYKRGWYYYYALPVSRIIASAVISIAWLSFLSHKGKFRRARETHARLHIWLLSEYYRLLHKCQPASWYIDHYSWFTSIDI